MGIFADTEAAVAAVFLGAAGEDVQYRRGLAALRLTAWRSPQPVVFGVDAGQGAVIQYQSWEWHLRAADLGSLKAPEPRDRIEAADGRVYEVLEVPGQACYHPGALLRIHTKFVDEEGAAPEQPGV